MLRRKNFIDSRIFFAPDDGAPGGDDTPLIPSLLNPKPEGTPAPPAPVPSKPGERPAYIDEKFWDPEKKEPRLESMAKAHTDTKTAYDRLLNDKGAFKGDYKTLFEDPASPGQVKLGEELKNIKAMKMDDPVFGSFLKAAEKYHLSDTQARGILSEVTSAMDPLLTPAEPFDEAKEMAKLGDNSAAVVAENVAWLEGLNSSGLLTDDQLVALRFIGQSADAVAALDKIRVLTGEQPIPAGDPKIQGALPTMEELYARKFSSRYDSDPDYRKETDELFTKVAEGMDPRQLAGVGLSSMELNVSGREKDRRKRAAAK